MTFPFHIECPSSQVGLSSLLGSRHVNQLPAQRCIAFTKPHSFNEAALRHWCSRIICPSPLP